jgi:hypothetical protein
LLCKSIPRVEGESIGKIMIIGHGMKDCSSWKQWSLYTGWICSSWCQEVLGYLSRTQLRARGMSQGFLAAVFEGWATQSHPITRILLATKRSRRRKKREKQKLPPYKIYSSHHS